MQRPNRSVRGGRRRTPLLVEMTEQGTEFRLGDLKGRESRSGKSASVVPSKKTNDVPPRIPYLSHGVFWIRIEHRTQNLDAISMLSRNVHARLAVVIQSLQGSMEIPDKVNDKVIQCVIRSLISKRVGPTFSAGQTM